MSTQPLPLSHTNNPALGAALCGLETLLPPIRYTAREGGEADFYGASDLIAAKLGLKLPLFTGRAASWTHGITGQGGELTSPKLVVQDEYRHSQNLVHTESTAKFLRGHGYNAVAVGAPFIYADETVLPVRLRSSVLVFPPHSTNYSSLNAKGEKLAYVDQVVQLKSRFKTVVASIGGADVLKGNWIHAFEAAGIPWVCGAWMHDRNGLVRMQRIMRSFEYVTTNIIGSHVAYAAYCGCRVVFHGENRELTFEDVVSHPHYKSNPELTDHVREAMFNEARLKARFPFLFCGFDDAPDLTSWGREQVGAENRKDAREIARLLGWDLQPEGAGWRPAHPLDTASNRELVQLATQALNEKRIEDVFLATNVVKKRLLKLRNVDLLRGLAFLLQNKQYPAREAIKEELRFFPDNAKAKEWVEKLGVTDHGVARLEHEGGSEFERFLKTVRPFTRVSHERARSLYDLARRVCEEDVPGDFIECGVAAGGSTMLLALVIQAHSKRPRKLHSFDTFEGMPAPGEQDTAKGVPADATGWGTGTCAAPESFIRENCAAIGVGDLVVTHKGMFEHTLPEFKHEVGEIGFLHMDGDWYSSTRAILDHLFEKLHPQALIQIDDFGAWDGCRKALEDYQAEKGLRFELELIDDTGRWCRNPLKVSAPKVRPASATAPVPRAPPAQMRAGGHHPFLNPALEPNNVDLFVVRSTILRAVKAALPEFHGTFLDIGCGVMPYKGLITSAPSRVNKYLGLDLAGSEIYHANVDLRWDGKTMPLGDASVDSAMATEVLEHCPDPLLVLREARRVLKPGGVFFFTVPFVWPLHDAPYDFFRYTPFALEKLLAEAGFTDVKLGAMSGWNASLAQMMGLYLKRSPLTPAARNQWAQKLWPLYQELVNSDQLPADSKAGNTMTTGWTGIAHAPATAVVAEAAAPAINEVEPSDLPVVIVRSHEHNYSETFLEDHVKFVSRKTTLLYGYPFPRFVGRRSILPEALEKRMQAALAGGGVTAELWRDYSAALKMFFTGCGARVALVETGLMGAFVHEACVRAALPFVVHFHGLDAFGRELLERWSAHYQAFFKTAAQLIVVSQAMRDQLVKLGAPVERVVLAPYGVAVKVARAADPATAGPTFVAVGRFVEKKAPHLTLMAFGAIRDQLPTARLVMIGDGKMLNACREWATKQGLAEAVTFAGVQSREAVSRQMAASGIFVQHSVTAANGDSEGLPLAVLEAGAHGLPVVSTFHGGISDAVRDGTDGFLVAEKDVQGMAQAMLRLAQDPALAARLGASFRERVRGDYSQRGSIERLQGLLLAAAEGRAVLGVGDQPAAAVAPVQQRSALEEAFGAIAKDRDDQAAYLKFIELRLQDGALADAYCAMGELHRITGGSVQTREVLESLEGQGVLDDPTVQTYRQRAGWAPLQQPVRTPQRILVVTNLLPPQEMGGYGRTMWEFSRELSARGHTVQVLTADLPHLLRQPTPDHAAFEPNVRRTLCLFGDWKQGAAVGEPDLGKRNAVARANHNLILATAEEFRPDIVMVGNLDFVGHLFVQKFLDRGLPVLHRLGNASPGYAPAIAPQSPLFCLAGCSDWVNDTLRAKGYSFARYAVLPPGSPLAEYYRAFPPQREVLRIAFASLLMPYKGAHVLMEALGYLKASGIAFDCTFAGDTTSPDYLETIKGFAAQRGFLDRLQFTGFLAKKELAALYARTNVLVFPSVFEEPFGKTQIEAMAAGLLVISSGNGGARDIIRDGETGLFFRNNDSVDLAEKLASVQRDPDRAGQIALAGQEASFRFTTAASVDRLEEIFVDLVKSATSVPQVTV